MFEKLTGWIGDLIWNYAGIFLLVLAFSAGAGLSWAINDWRWEARFAALEKSNAQTAQQQAEALSQALENTLTLERRGTALAARLLEAEALQRKIAKEKDDAIRKNTLGRPCLDAAVVRLLNDAPRLPAGAGLRLPPTAGEPAHADRTAAADSGIRDQESGINPKTRRSVLIPDTWHLIPDSRSVSNPIHTAEGATLFRPTEDALTTDTDISLWAREARDQHDACRARIDALRLWHEGATP
ncbi:hypothetical protein AGMMS50256_35930 [Betaproteobacteria bacterium]|nr:hypothetical protein AGMMS50256_35930 [Betaproteobacteria bacterium]